MIVFPDNGNKQYPIRSNCKEGCSKNGAIKISRVAATEMGIQNGQTNVRWQFVSLAQQPPAPAPAQPAQPQTPFPAIVNPKEQHGAQVTISDFKGQGACNQPLDFTTQAGIAIVR
jgi:hypothetical protein